MMNPFKLSEKIAGLTPYDPISGDYPIRLDANESFLDLPEETRADMLARIAALPLNRYPDPSAGEICRLFADYTGVKTENITAGNGSDELLSIITQAFLMKGDVMLTVEGDFSMYRFYGGLAEGRMVTVSRDKDEALSASEVINSIEKNGVKLFLFSNPCNPTSVGITLGEVLRIVRSCPDCMIVADEAYMDFWDQSVVDAINEYSNLIVLKTCSKAFRMAGIRCGFALSCPQVANVMRAVKSPYNLSSLTQAAAAAILSRPDELRDAVARVKAARDELLGGLRAIEARNPGRLFIPESRANFVWIGLEDAQAAFESLKSRGIIVRCMAGHLRVTAGSPEENIAFLEAFEERFDNNPRNAV